MKMLFLVIFAVAGAANALALGGGFGMMGLITLPFSLLGKLLRWLSELGLAGKLAAFALYVPFCLSPLLLKGKKKWQREDVLLAVAAGMLFWVMYLLSNPGAISGPLSGSAGETVCVGGMLSVLVAWGVIKLLRVSRRVRQEKVYQALRLFLLICAANLVFIGFNKSGLLLLSTVKVLKQLPYGDGLSRTIAVAVQIALAVVWLVEYCFDAAVMLRGATLLRCLEQDPYGQPCIHAAESLASISREALVCIILSQAALNVAQVLLIKHLYLFSVELNLPVRSLALVFTALALTRLLSQGRQLKEDNDLFI